MFSFLSRASRTLLRLVMHLYPARASDEHLQGHLVKTLMSSGQTEVAVKRTQITTPRCWPCRKRKFHLFILGGRRGNYTMEDSIQGWRPTDDDWTMNQKNIPTKQGVTSILLYGCTTWTLTKRLEKKLDGNYTRMLRAILNKSWRQHPTRHQLYGHLPPITKTIQVRRTRHSGHCWRSRDELIRDVLLCTPTHSRAKAGRPARTYIQQLCEDTGCCPEDLPRAMNDREEWRERVRDIRATSAI